MVRSRSMWFPPFVPIAAEDTWGAYAWVVKQDNNGTAFVASQTELPFERLLAQNSDRAVWEDRLPVGKAHLEHQLLIKKLNALSSEFDLNLKAAKRLSSREEPIRVALIEQAQGHMVQELQGFLDDCYLQLLIEIIAEGNRSALKLRKANVRLNPGAYVHVDADSDTAGWFTLTGLVSDMWRDYGFQPFPEKLSMLFGPPRIQIKRRERISPSTARIDSELYSASRGPS